MNSATLCSAMGRSPQPSRTAGDKQATRRKPAERHKVEEIRSFAPPPPPSFPPPPPPPSPPTVHLTAFIRPRCATWHIATRTAAYRRISVRPFLHQVR